MGEAITKITSLSEGNHGSLTLSIDGVDSARLCWLFTNFPSTTEVLVASLSPLTDLHRGGHHRGDTLLRAMAEQLLARYPLLTTVVGEMTSSHIVEMFSQVFGEPATGADATGTLPRHPAYDAAGDLISTGVMVRYKMKRSM